ncbi:MAG: dTDP-4-dehydrorhamnose reductase [Methyloprofundus sp.]|nr:dTDP-4-dehydrorhamnose reductase [Methyloprofundus sp.]
MKILLFGKNGQVGWELQRSLVSLGELIALDQNSQDYCGDLTDLQGLAETVQQIKPDIIVNAAAYTAVDKAQSEPELARLINADAVAVLAQEAKKIAACLVHYSTDYVFDGSGTVAWQEADMTAPLNIYGVTKLAAEQAIQASGCQYLIFRTSWVYATRGNNFAKTMLRLAQEQESLSVIDDQIGAPTGADLLADVTALALYRLQTQPELSGLYHLSAAGETSWYGFAQLVITYAEKKGFALKVFVADINAVSSSEFSTAAQRPLNSRLNSEQLQTNFCLTLPVWDVGVLRMLEEVMEDSNDTA